MISFISMAFYLLLPSSHSTEFKTFWSAVKSNHPELKSSQEEKIAAEEASFRGSRHWLPQVFLLGRGLNTNDSLYSFMGNLGQRAVTASDFSPDSLNHPSRQNFAQIGLALNLPLYEGGMSLAYSDMQNHILESKESSNSATMISVYTAMVSSYAGALNSESALHSLEDLKLRVSAVINRYTLGAKSNPVGYSGLLGLKSIANRIDAAINQVKSENDSHKNEMIQRAEVLAKGFVVHQQDVGPFLIESLPAAAILNSDDSYSLSSAESGVAMSKARISMERARFLPQFGLFSEGNMTTGNRNTGSSYVGGVYLKWSLFNPKDFGLVGESIHEKNAAEAKLENARVSEKIAREELKKSLETILQNEKILASSSMLMNEQVETAARLFQSGAINALQLVEVLNRRADLILQIKELNQNHIQVRTQLAKISRLKGMSL